MLELRETFPILFPWRNTFAESILDSLNSLEENFTGKKGLLFLSGGADSEFLASLLLDKVDYMYIDWGDEIGKGQAIRLAERLSLNFSIVRLNLERYSGNWHTAYSRQYWAPTLWTSLYFSIASDFPQYDYFLKGGEITLSKRNSEVVANVSRSSRDNDLNLISDIILKNPCTIYHIAKLMDEKNISYDVAKVQCYETLGISISSKMKRTGFEKFVAVALTPNNGPTWYEEYPDFYFTVKEIYDEFYN